MSAARALPRSQRVCVVLDRYAIARWLRPRSGAACIGIGRSADRRDYCIWQRRNAVAALKAGAFDYLTKPVDINQLRMLVRSAVRESVTSAESPAAPSSPTGGGVARQADRRYAGDATDAHDDQPARAQHGAGGNSR